MEQKVTEARPRRREKLIRWLRNKFKRKPRQKVIVVSSWKYKRLIRKVYKKVRRSGFDPDYVVFVARGGLVPGVTLSYLLDKPYVVVVAEHWPRGVELPDAEYSRHCAYNIKPLGKVLFVDDLTDTGKTVMRGVEYIENKFPDVEEVMIVTVYHKETSEIVPDHYGKKLRASRRTGRVAWVLKPEENPKPPLLISRVRYEEIGDSDAAEPGDE